MTDRYFVEEAKKINDSAEILNWYRNLYHCESETTERGVMARAINDILPEYARQKAEIERLQEAGKEAVSCFTRMESLYKIKCKELEVAKSEAIKEFWDKLKKETMTHRNLGEIVYVEVGDDLVKEMVGDDNATH